MSTAPNKKRYTHFYPEKFAINPSKHLNCTNITWTPGGHIWTTDKPEHVTCPECLERLDGRGK